MALGEAAKKLRIGLALAFALVAIDESSNSALDTHFKAFIGPDFFGKYFRLILFACSFWLFTGFAPIVALILSMNVVLFLFVSAGITAANGTEVENVNYLGVLLLSGIGVAGLFVGTFLHLIGSSEQHESTPETAADPPLQSTVGSNPPKEPKSDDAGKQAKKKR
eukprot:TRINITY_DN68808_c0_g1_i1.p1 TRINITY_DN68808_c0_g1~~TRINITY_DN68808_c0_g1_i1.p1  ORF type:complete len:172 (+),score=34.72 TRINITY_DN68808_c0_g1_i1:22-516(+)